MFTATRMSHEMEKTGLSNFIIVYNIETSDIVIARGDRKIDKKEKQRLKSS